MDCDGSDQRHICHTREWMYSYRYSRLTLFLAYMGMAGERVVLTLGAKQNPISSQHKSLAQNLSQVQRLDAAVSSHSMCTQLTLTSYLPRNTPWQ